MNTCVLKEQIFRHVLLSLYDYMTVNTKQGAAAMRQEEEWCEKLIAAMASCNDRVIPRHH